VALKAEVKSTIKA